MHHGVTVSVPTMPDAAWLSTVQWNAYLPVASTPAHDF
jgi:hypothetical protein